MFLEKDNTKAVDGKLETTRLLLCYDGLQRAADGGHRVSLASCRVSPAGLVDFVTVQPKFPCFKFKLSAAPGNIWVTQARRSQRA